jgi:hypothetical protein
MIVSTDTEKTLDNTKPPFLIKTLSKLRIERNFLNVIKDRYEKSTAYIIIVKD